MIPDLTVLWVIALLLTCVYVLNVLVFQPILRVIAAREQAVAGARDLAQTSADRASAASAEYDRTLNAARAEVYRGMDEKRREALDRRAAVLGETRAVVEQELAAASQAVREQSVEAREQLDRDAQSLSGAIVARVLGR